MNSILLLHWSCWRLHSINMWRKSRRIMNFPKVVHDRAYLPRWKIWSKYLKTQLYLAVSCISISQPEKVFGKIFLSKLNEHFRENFIPIQTWYIVPFFGSHYHTDSPPLPPPLLTTSTTITTNDTCTQTLPQTPTKIVQRFATRLVRELRVLPMRKD